MQRNEETLSTRDLASTSDPATGAAPASDLPPVPGEQSGEAPATVYDREATDGERANREATDYETVDREATDYETVDREAASGASLGADTTARNTGSQAVGSAPGRATDPASPAGPASSATTQRCPAPHRRAEHYVPTTLGGGADPIRRRASRGGGGRGRIGCQPHAAAR